jgi:hypothetical protein
VEPIDVQFGTYFSGLRIHGATTHFDLTAPPGEFWDGFSVAQGGRLISVDLTSGGHATYRFANGQWSRLGGITSSGYAHRIYLERDTAFVRDSLGALASGGAYQAWPQVLLRRGSQPTGPRTLFTDAYPLVGGGVHAESFVYDLALDPSGTWLAGSVLHPLSDFSVPHRGTSTLVARLAGGATTVIDRYITSNFSYNEATPDRVPFPGPFAWNDVGGGLLVALPIRRGTNCELPGCTGVPGFTETGIRTDVLRYNAEGSGAPDRIAEATVDGWSVEQLFWDPEGFRFRAQEYDLTYQHCRLVVRSVRNPGTIAQTIRTGTGPSGCGRLGGVSPDRVVADARRVPSRRALTGDRPPRRPLIALRARRFN